MSRMDKTKSLPQKGCSLERGGRSEISDLYQVLVSCHHLTHYPSKLPSPCPLPMLSVASASFCPDPVFL